MEVQDILVLRSHPLLRLDQSHFSVSPLKTRRLEQDFLDGIPFAYLTRHSEFYGRTFFIDQRVLIPRQETELLVDHLVQLGRKRPFKRVLDVGVGSGVILLSLMAEKVAQSGVGADLSEAALGVARMNAQRLRVREKCEFVRSDRLQSVQGKFDMIVSNPPYIKAKLHRGLVHDKVDEFEPSVALYLRDEDYEGWFTAFFKEALAHLEPGGVFMMEGHELELEHQGRLLEALGFQGVQVIKDLAGLPRFLHALGSANV